MVSVRVSPEPSRSCQAAQEMDVGEAVGLVFVRRDSFNVSVPVRKGFRKSPRTSGVRPDLPLDTNVWCVHYAESLPWSSGSRENRRSSCPTNPIGDSPSSMPGGYEL